MPFCNPHDIKYLATLEKLVLKDWRRELPDPDRLLHPGLVCEVARPLDKVGYCNRLIIFFDMVL